VSAVLLDLACGPGRVTLDLAGSFEHVNAIDLEAEMIEVMKSEPSPAPRPGNSASACVRAIVWCWHGRHRLSRTSGAAKRHGVEKREAD